MTMNGNAVPQLVTEAPAPEDIPKKLTPEERLQVENLYLKVENLVLQQQRMQEDVQRSVKMRLEFQQQMTDLQNQLAEKYGCDMSKVKILPDGTIVQPV